MFAIEKRWTISAAHSLPYLPEGHKCRRVHGHNYEISLRLGAATLDEKAFVIDYAEMAPFAERLQAFDHQNLNDFLAQPTAENLAAHLYDLACSLFERGRIVVVAVRVSETPNTWAEYPG